MIDKFSKYIDTNVNCELVLEIISCLNNSSVLIHDSLQSTKSILNEQIINKRLNYLLLVDDVK